MIIYTIGYSGSSHEDLRRYIKETRGMLIDVRFSPRSRAAMWNGPAIAMAVGAENYTPVEALGNVNYRSDGPVKLADPQAGAQAISRIFNLHNRPVILMCACKEVYECHRWTAAHYLARALPAYMPKIVHLPARFDKWQRGEGQEEVGV